MWRRRLKRVWVVAKLLLESVLFALEQLRLEKFRSLLSLIGVSIGIFTIVGIFTAIDVLSNSVESSLKQSPDNLIIIQKWPSVDELEESRAFEWWKYENRPHPSFEEYKYLRNNLKTAGAISFSAVVLNGYKVKNGKKVVSDVTVSFVGGDYQEVRGGEIPLEKGRYFSPLEEQSGTPVVMLGADIAEQLFSKEVNPIDREIYIEGKKFTVVGVLKRQGESIITFFNDDRNIYAPLNFGRSFVKLSSLSCDILITPNKGEDYEIFKAEVDRTLRSYRRMGLVEERNFSFQEVSSTINIVDKSINKIRKIGWMIAAFSLLIGGFGIANIMFVSVKERTNIIGIQKALGAKRYIILAQFLVESAILAIFGGIVGEFLVWCCTLVANYFSSYQITLSLVNVLFGLLISIVIGVLSGIIPALNGARLNPIQAINSK